MLQALYYFSNRLLESTVYPCHPWTSEYRTGHSTPGEVSPVLSNGKGSPPWIWLQCPQPNVTQAATIFLKLQRHSAGSCFVWCPLEIKGHFLKNCFSPSAGGILEVPLNIRISTWSVSSTSQFHNICKVIAIVWKECGGMSLLECPVWCVGSIHDLPYVGHRCYQSHVIPMDIAHQIQIFPRWWIPHCLWSG